MKKKSIFWGIGIAITISLLVSAGHCLHAFRKIENISYDWRVRTFRKDKAGSDEIAIILIDEQSLAALNPIVGRWPWPRDLYRDIFSFLKMGGAKAILTDILFTENEKSPYDSKGQLGENDSILVDSVAGTGIIYSSVQLLHDTEDETNKDLLNRPLPDDFISKFSLKVNSRIDRTNGNNVYYLPFTELYRASHGIGIVEFSSDHDGVYRKTPLIRRYQNNYFPTLSIAPLQDIYKIEEINLSEERIEIKRSQGKISIPLTYNNYFINYYKGFNSYSISGILSSMQAIRYGEAEKLTINPSEFRDKIVFVGASAVGVEDLKSTPLSTRMPGVELHASILSNILNQDFLHVRGTAVAILHTLFISLLISTMVILLPNTTTKIGGSLLSFGLLLGWLFFSFRNNIVYNIATPFVGGSLTWLTSFAYLSFTEGKDKRRVKRMFSQYLSPDLINEVMKNYDGIIKASIGKKENITILFSDIRGFTNISEKLPPEEVVNILNQYLSKMSDVIFEYSGTLDKFIGDAILAFWGAPVKQENHALQGVASSIKMIEALEELNKILAKSGNTLDIGIGLNSGEAILGNIGSEKKLDYTVIGDNVNLASRLEGLNKPYQTKILISESTYQMLEGKIPCRLVDMVRVKGKIEPIKIYAPLYGSESKEEKREIERLSIDAFESYIGRDWDRAIILHHKLIGLIPDDQLSPKFIDHCQSCKGEEPPEDWDGVCTFTTK